MWRSIRPAVHVDGRDREIICCHVIECHAICDLKCFEMCYAVVYMYAVTWRCVFVFVCVQKSIQVQCAQRDLSQ